MVVQIKVNVNVVDTELRTCTSIAFGVERQDGVTELLKFVNDNGWKDVG